MKKVMSLIMVAFLMCQFLNAQDVFTTDDIVLPTAAKEFIDKHFSGSHISFVKIDRERFGTEGYKVNFRDGSEVEFDANGNWVEVDGSHKPIPTEFIPSAITEYVKNNFSDNKITKIEKEPRKYKIDLDNEMELDFDIEGRLLKIDD